MSTCQLVTGTAATGNINTNTNTVTTNPGTAIAPSAWFGVLFANAFGNQFTSGTSVLGMYMTITTTGSPTAPIGTTAPATAGTVSGVQAYIVGYNSQAACTAAMAAATNAASVGTGAAFLMGGYATCQQYTAWTQGTPTTTNSVTTYGAPPQVLTTNWVSTLVNGCGVGIAPTAAPTTAPAAARPLNVADAMMSLKSSLATSGKNFTTVLQTTSPGIVVSNPTFTNTSNSVTATHNIPSGVTTAQTQTPAFQSAFSKVASTMVQAVRVMPRPCHPSE
jgi:hypothetical protein